MSHPRSYQPYCFASLRGIWENRTPVEGLEGARFTIKLISHVCVLLRQCLDRTHPLNLVPPLGFEPRVHRLRADCSSPLCYRGKCGYRWDRTTDTVRCYTLAGCCITALPCIHARRLGGSNSYRCYPIAGFKPGKHANYANLHVVSRCVIIKKQKPPRA